MTLGRWFLVAQLCFLAIQIGCLFWQIASKDKLKPLAVGLLMMVLCLMSGAIGRALRQSENAKATANVEDIP